MKALLLDSIGVATDSGVLARGRAIGVVQDWELLKSKG
jgi:hypothetical protein